MDAKAFAHIRHLPQAVKVLLKNLTFIFLSLAEASEGAMVAGCTTFMPKVIENQFGFSAGFAALCVGEFWNVLYICIIWEKGCESFFWQNYSLILLSNDLIVPLSNAIA